MMPNNPNQADTQEGCLAILLTILMVILISSVGSCFSSPSSSSSSSSVSSTEERVTIRRDRHYTVKDTAFAYSSEDVFEKTYALQKQGDTAAYENLMKAYMLSGDVSVYSPGDRVIVMDRSWKYNLSKIRKEGELYEYWVLNSCLKE